MYLRIGILNWSLKQKMINGINYITDETGNNKAIILDLVRFKKDGIQEAAVFEALINLQQLIDSAPLEGRDSSTWNQAKERLKNFKP